MRASGSTAALGRVSYLQVPAPAQFHRGQLRVRRVVQSFDKTRSNRLGPRQPKFHSGHFACSRLSFFCWKVTSQYLLVVVLWKY